MQIRLKVDTSRMIPLREVVGVRSLRIELPEGSTVNDLLVSLDQKFGFDFQKKTGKKLSEEVMKRYSIVLNNAALWLPQQLSFVLKRGDEIKILLLSGGG